MVMSFSSCRTRGPASLRCLPPFTISLTVRKHGDLVWADNFYNLQSRVETFWEKDLLWPDVNGAESLKFLLQYLASRSIARNGQKGRDEKGVACCTQAKQRQGRPTPSPSRCAYQHTNKGSTWVSSAFLASWLWWGENCDLQLATWRHICGFPVVLRIKENNAQLDRPDVWKESHFVRSSDHRTEDYQSILECWSCFS